MGAMFLAVLMGGAWLLTDLEPGGDLTMDAGVASSDVDTLAKLITLPSRPVWARWQVLEPAKGRAGLGPADWALVAVMRWEGSELDELIGQAELIPPESPLLDSPFDELLAPEVRALIADAVARPDKAEWRSAELFARQPLLHGYCVVSRESSQAVLFLFTM